MTSTEQSRRLRPPNSSEVKLLTAVIVLLTAIPSKLIVPAFGSAGTPAQLMGLVLLALWVFSRIGGTRRPPPGQPVRIAMRIVVIAILLSFLAASTRPITPLELSAADRGLMSTFAWFGIFLIAADGLANLRDLNTVLRRLSLATGLMAILGIFQFITGILVVNLIKIPGMVNNTDAAIETRGNHLVRATGTAVHSIEFGAVLTMVLPIALHFAMQDSGRKFLARWWQPIVIALAIPMTVARSAIVSGIIVMAFILPTWEKPVRRKAYAVLVVMAGFLYVTVPGLAGTFRSLFTGVSSDTSTQSRTDSYALAWRFVFRAPFFGRGFRTFLPSYRILDNQYLGLMIEVGFVGFVAFVFLFLCGVVTGVGLHRRSPDPRIRSLAQALAACTASTAATFALYDALSFPMAAGMLFLTLGCLSALLRLAKQAEEAGKHSTEAIGYVKLEDQVTLPLRA